MQMQLSYTIKTLGLYKKNLDLRLKMLERKEKNFIQNKGAISSSSRPKIIL